MWSRQEPWTHGGQPCEHEEVRAVSGPQVRDLRVGQKEGDQAEALDGTEGAHASTISSLRGSTRKLSL